MSFSLFQTLVVSSLSILFNLFPTILIIANFRLSPDWLIHIRKLMVDILTHADIIEIGNRPTLGFMFKRWRLFAWLQSMHLIGIWIHFIWFLKLIGEMGWGFLSVNWWWLIGVLLWFIVSYFRMLITLFGVLDL